MRYWCSFCIGTSAAWALDFALGVEQSFGWMSFMLGSILFQSFMFVLADD